LHAKLRRLNLEAIPSVLKFRMAARKSRDKAQRRVSRTPERPKPPFPPQRLQAPGLDSRLDQRPRYEAKDYRPAQKLEGKSALITGGDPGIGRAVALLCTAAARAIDQRTEEVQHGSNA
jgi:hypothetical protein